MNQDELKLLKERALDTAKAAYSDDSRAIFVSGLMVGFHLRESKKLRAELEQVSKDRYRATTEVARLRDDNNQMRTVVGDNLDNLRQAVKGIEGAL